MYTCRECERPINQATEICPYCGADLTDFAHVEEEEPGKRRWVAYAVLLAIPVAALWAFLWFILPERTDRASVAEARALATVEEIASALAAYADAQGRYPASLEAMGDRLRGPAQMAQGEGYTIEYALGSSEGERGRLPSSPGTVQAVAATDAFTLRLQPRNYGYLSFYTDQTGIIRANRENRPATVQDPPLPE